LKNVQFCLFRGLKFEPDAEIGQKGAFCKGFYATVPQNRNGKAAKEAGEPEDLPKQTDRLFVKVFN
jgi:hypothetical protein